MGRDFFFFFFFLLYIYVLNITQIFYIFVSQHLIATHGRHIHRHQFLTANYFLYVSYLAVTMATWQHWSSCRHVVLPTGRLFGRITQKGPNKITGSRIFSSAGLIFWQDWPKNSSKSWQHCLLHCSHVTLRTHVARGDSLESEWSLRKSENLFFTKEIWACNWLISRD